jgi:membrane-associated HD superfamily phosphohydrolase
VVDQEVFSADVGTPKELLSQSFLAFKTAWGYYTEVILLLAFICTKSWWKKLFSNPMFNCRRLAMALVGDGTSPPPVITTSSPTTPSFNVPSSSERSVTTMTSLSSVTIMASLRDMESFLAKETICGHVYRKGSSAHLCFHSIMEFPCTNVQTTIFLKVGRTFRQSLHQNEISLGQAGDRAGE